MLASRSVPKPDANLQEAALQLTSATSDDGTTASLVGSEAGAANNAKTIAPSDALAIPAPVESEPTAVVPEVPEEPKKKISLQDYLKRRQEAKAAPES